MQRRDHTRICRWLQFNAAWKQSTKVFFTIAALQKEKIGSSIIRLRTLWSCQKIHMSIWISFAIQKVTMPAILRHIEICTTDDMKFILSSLKTRHSEYIYQTITRTKKKWRTRTWARNLFFCISLQCCFHLFADEILFSHELLLAAFDNLVSSRYQFWNWWHRFGRVRFLWKISWNELNLTGGECLANHLGWLNNGQQRLTS